jgi:hypothetical protein
LTAVLSAGLAFGGSGGAPSLSGPTLGLVFDRAAENLRPIAGIPGAAITGAPLPLDGVISQTAIAPAQNAALVVKARDAAVALVTAAGGDWVMTALDGVPPAPASMVFSPGGSAAALYYAAGHVQILTGLPAAPRVGTDIDVSSLPTPVSALAVDDAGGFLLLATGPAEAVSLYRVGANSAASLLGSFRSVSSLRLFRTGQQALLTDALAGTVYRITDVAGAAAVETVAGAGDGIQGLLAADTDAAGQRGFAAASNGTVYLFDFNGGRVTTLDCGCVPTGLFRLAGAAVFRLTEPGVAPIQVLDANTTPRIVAVPPPGQAIRRQEVRP